MTNTSYARGVERKEKLLVWAKGAEAISSPPMPVQARVDAGYLLRLVQRGHSLSSPVSEPRTDIGPGCHELRLTAEKTEWRVFYHVSPDVVLVLGVFPKKTQKTPQRWEQTCRSRLRLFNESLRPKE